MMTTFSLAWAKYKDGNDFARSMNILEARGMARQYAENILFMAFGGGWGATGIKIEILNQDNMDKQSKEFKAGFDAGLNGANTTNSHFSHFATTEGTRDWEAGQQAGKQAKKDSEKKSRHNPRKK